MLKEIRSRLKAQKVIVAMLKKKPTDQLEATHLEQSIEDSLREFAGTHGTGKNVDSGRQNWLSQVHQKWRIFLATLEAAVKSMPSASWYPTISDLSESIRKAAPTADNYRTFTVTRVRMSQFGPPQYENVHRESETC
ncbi:hypothetical protein GQ607_002373 [Colletotrichum asianum]|uniref:Uncharacterized protein n=1 Tax=Colletotrichum asianum TaxID=702518 RepID=A0A8H3WN90_9PEZI|nr:hypothetical protein GQ607_002373 [Colletotrichum asianum]